MALIRSGCPAPGRAAWKSLGLGGVGNGFLAPQPNCSTFWTASPRRGRSRPELSSFLEQEETFRANGRDNQPHSSWDEHPPAQRAHGPLEGRGWRPGRAQPSAAS